MATKSWKTKLGDIIPEVKSPDSAEDTLADSIAILTTPLTISVSRWDSPVSVFHSLENEDKNTTKRTGLFWTIKN